MLTAGIIVMVASLVLGVIGLTLVVLMSSAARTAGRNTRVAMGLSAPEVGAPGYGPSREGAIYQAEAPYPPAEEDAPYYAVEQEARDPAEAPYPPAEEDAPYYAVEQEVRDPAEAEAPYPPAEGDAAHYAAEGDAPHYAEQDPPYYAAEQEGRDHPAAVEAPTYSAEAEAPAAAEPEQPARWVLALLVLSGAGVALGLLMAMIGSVT